MMLAVLINGRGPEAASIAADDRGLNYGDGLFETLCLRSGAIRFLDAHLDRLARGCTQLSIEMPSHEVLRADLETITRGIRDGVVKIVVTRGAGGRGYRPGRTTPTRIVSLHPAPTIPAAAKIRVRWCETRFARNAKLAGLKHLNRLEQVLAQAEWDDQAIAEGLMLDTEGELVSVTAGNVFLVRDGVLVTPDLRFCGVRGVMRAQVLKAAAQLGVATQEEPLWPHDIDAASELFVTSAVRGIRPIVALESLEWSASPVAARIAAQIEQA